jgi:hypothetical protein
MSGAPAKSGPDPNVIANAFVKHYYTLFDSDRSQLAPLYVSCVVVRWLEREGIVLSISRLCCRCQ